MRFPWNLPSKKQGLSSLPSSLNWLLGACAPRHGRQSQCSQRCGFHGVDFGRKPHTNTHTDVHGRDPGLYAPTHHTRVHSDMLGLNLHPEMLHCWAHIDTHECSDTPGTDHRQAGCPRATQKDRHKGRSTQPGSGKHLSCPPAPLQDSAGKLAAELPCSEEV